jgi:hypothetical protein
MLTRTHSARPASPTIPFRSIDAQIRRWRAVLLAAVTGTLIAGGAAAGLQSASAATVDTGASYVLTSRHSGKALDVHNLSTAGGAGIVQYTRNDGAWQQWQFVDAGSGWYKIRSQHSGKVLELPNATDGTPLIQNADNGITRPPSAPWTPRAPAPAPGTRPSGWPTATAGSAAPTRPPSGSAR